MGLLMAACQMEGEDERGCGVRVRFRWLMEDVDKPTGIGKKRGEGCLKVFSFSLQL